MSQSSLPRALIFSLAIIRRATVIEAKIESTIAVTTRAKPGPFGCGAIDADNWGLILIIRSRLVSLCKVCQKTRIHIY